jgi:hypothetical protein
MENEKISNTNNSNKWHQKPLHLSIAQENDPLSVLDNFFNEYSLPQIRSLLKIWLHYSIINKEAPEKELKNLSEQMTELIEACWIISRK